MQPWRPESELDGINSGSWYHCLPMGIYSKNTNTKPIYNAPISPSKKPESEVRLIRRGGCIAVVCEVVCYTEVRPGLSGKKMKWHFSERR